jgi:F0F1-type ATP synthase delta subunit
MFVNLDEISKALQEHNKLIRDVYKNPQMTPSDKRQLIDTIYYRMIELGRAGKAMSQQINRTLGPQP